MFDPITQEEKNSDIYGLRIENLLKMKNNCMKFLTALKILEYHQQWRCGKLNNMIYQPSELTEAINILIASAKTNEKYTNISKYSIIHDTIRDIMNTDDATKFQNLAEYCELFRNDEDRGSIRTVLMICKSFRENEHIKDIFTILADKLREGSTNGII